VLPARSNAIEALNRQLGKALQTKLVRSGGVIAVSTLSGAMTPTRSARGSDALAAEAAVFRRGMTWAGRRLVVVSGVARGCQRRAWPVIAQRCAGAGGAAASVRRWRARRSG
jgi:hypothetical protein